MPTIELGCRLVYYVEFETSFIFQIGVLESPRQRIAQESLSFEPNFGVRQARTGVAGHRMHRMRVQPGWFNVHYSATVHSEPALVPGASLGSMQHADLPADTLEFLNPSRYCESDRLESFAWKTFGQTEGSLAMTRHVVSWVHDHMSYVPGSTGLGSTACDVFLQRQGVCRDYAHLTIALCRALGIPARYVAGYAVNLVPPDFHGLVEVFIDDDWYLFDPTRLAPLEGFVRIGIGRDAADLSFSTFVGNSVLNEMHVWANAPDGSMPAVPAGHLLSLC